MKDTITLAEARAMIIEYQIASAFRPGYSKRLKLRYDIGRARLYWLVVLQNNDALATRFGALEDAIEAYNEA